jgi:hypothetical protein
MTAVENNAIIMFMSSKDDGLSNENSIKEKETKITPMINNRILILKVPTFKRAVFSFFSI